MITRVVSFQRGDRLPEPVTLTCPEGTRVAGMLPPTGRASASATRREPRSASA